MIIIDPYIKIIIALLGLAYPILLQVIARLDEKYESENIATLFKTEWEWKAFRYTLIASLVAVFIWSLKFEPVIELNELTRIICNSEILVASTAILLVISFFFFVNKVIKYYTPYGLIRYLIASHEKSNSPVKYIPELSDLFLLSIKRQQTSLARPLSIFFAKAFWKIRDKSTNEPVTYPYEYYDTAYKAIEELAILKEKRTYFLEHRISVETWLLGGMQGKGISDITYACLWKSLLLAVRYKQDDLIVNHWKTCHQYYVSNLPYISPKYDQTTKNFQVSNQESVDKREEERLKFIEFHYALGGLLTYKERYTCMKRLFRHTQSEPGKYELLPESMYEIFKFYFDIKDPFYERKYSWISHKYPFPELSGLNADGAIKQWIMSYMAILFLRQHTIHPYLMTMRPLDFPLVPDTQSEIRKWINGLDFFKKLVIKHLRNEELLKTLNLDFITHEWCSKNEKLYPTEFIEKFKAKLEGAYHTNAMTLPLSDEKVTQFFDATKMIIESAIEKLQPINNATTIEDNNSEKFYVNGQKRLQSKDAFSENPEVSHTNFESFLASIISTNIDKGLGAMFFQKISKSYLLKSEDILRAIDKLGINDDYVIINFGINLDHYINQLPRDFTMLQKPPSRFNKVVFRIKECFSIFQKKINDVLRKKPSTGKYIGTIDIQQPKIHPQSHVPKFDRYNNIKIYSFSGSQLVRNSLFILKKSDLPNISTKSIPKDITAKYSLHEISDSINLYSSVIDLNSTTEEVYNENKKGRSDDELRKSVLMNIYIAIEFKWKRSIEVIKLEEYSEYLQRGIANKLDDIKPVIPPSEFLKTVIDWFSKNVIK